MIALLLSIACSAAIVLIFRQFESRRINNFPAIVVNYLVCVLTGGLVFGFDVFNGNFWLQPWFLWALLLGTFFIVSFQLIARCVQENGVTVATLASKLSLVIPVVLAFPLYGDSLNSWKVMGLILAIMAVFFSTHRGKSKHGGGLLLPILTWMIGGVIETILNYTQANYLLEGDSNGFLTFLFGTAFVIGLASLAFSSIRRGRLPASRDVFAGVVLGIPNYGSIYFLILALSQKGWESSVVFPVNNIGVIILSATLAWLMFNERLSRINLFGLFLAIVSITLILFSSPLFNQ